MTDPAVGVFPPLGFRPEAAFSPRREQLDRIDRAGFELGAAAPTSDVAPEGAAEVRHLLRREAG